MNECRHGLSEDCPGCMQETIDALAKALRELPSSTEQVEALRESEVTWIVKELGDSIANLGYPVGMGIAPHTEQLKRAAEALFERWCKMASKIACFTPAQRAPIQSEAELCKTEIARAQEQDAAISASEAEFMDELRRRNAQRAPDNEAVKLVYIKRWRTIVKLPAKYADEIVEALRMPDETAVTSTPSQAIEKTEGGAS